MLPSWNKTDAAWREYQKSACGLQFATFHGGSGGAPAELECELKLDRDDVKLLADLFNLQQMAS